MTQTETTMKASDLMVQALEKEGVQWIFAVPGEENLDFVESLRGSTIKLIVCRHEQAAAFMAATIGRLSGKAGVCLSTLGPGATNFVTGAAYAQLGGMPMMMITGQKPIKHSKQGHFQIVNVVEMMHPITKFTKQIVSGYNIPAAVREAFRLAQEERPGAVHLELPEDIAAEHVEKITAFEPSPVRRPIAEEKAIRIAVEMINAAKHPLLLVGAGANRKMTQKMLREFIDKTGIPFFNTQMGKGVIDERHPLYIGTAALSSNDFLHEGVRHADLIINVGHDVIEKPPFFMTRGGVKVIHVNFYSAEVDEVYFPNHEVVGDIANAIWQLKESISKNPNWDFTAFFAAKANLDEHLLRDAHSDQFPLKPQRIVNDVREIMPDDGIICLDNGMYKIWFARHYKAHAPNTILLDNALATMGAGVPSAMAAKILHPNRSVLAIAGDGGFMMNSQELETAVRLGLHLVILIINDNGYGMIKWKQDSAGFHNFGLDLGNPDFVKYAEAYGAHGYRVMAANELKKHLTAAYQAGKGVHLIEVPVDYTENVKVLTNELKTLHNHP